MPLIHLPRKPPTALKRILAFPDAYFCGVGVRDDLTLLRSVLGVADEGGFWCTALMLIVRTVLGESKCACCIKFVLQVARFVCEAA